MGLPKPRRISSARSIRGSKPTVKKRRHCDNDARDLSRGPGVISAESSNSSISRYMSSRFPFFRRLAQTTPLILDGTGSSPYLAASCATIHGYRGRSSSPNVITPGPSTGMRVPSFRKLSILRQNPALESRTPGTIGPSATRGS